MSEIGQLRWLLYSKHQVDGDLLPPTPSALKFKLLRCNFIALVWKRKIYSLTSVIPSITDNHGWNNNNGQYIPIMTDQLPAPEFTLELAWHHARKPNVLIRGVHALSWTLSALKHVSVLTVKMSIKDLKALMIDL